MDFIQQPDGPTRLGDWLIANLTGPWTHFRAAVAFAKRSGTKHIAAPLAAFAGANTVEIIVGIDHGGTSGEGLRDLLQALSPSGRVLVFHNRLIHTFHPKVYLFKSGDAAEVAVGSGNLTEGGLFTNYEAGLRVALDTTDPVDAAVLQSVETILDHWASPTHGMSVTLDNEILDQLTKSSVVPVEQDMRPETPSTATEHDDEDSPADMIAALFSSRSERQAPASSRNRTSVIPHTAGRRFVMTLQRTDVGVGQMTSGTSKRSPEIFVPLAARNANPTFWGWPTDFREDPSKPGKFDRTVRMRLGGQLISVNMMTWPDRHDFRLRNEALRASGDIGDILRMERVDASLGFEYFVEIIPRGTDPYRTCMPRCNQLVRPPSRKRFGYY